MKLTEYSRAQIQQLVNDGVCTVQTLRDYDLLKEIENGQKITYAADNARISYMQANRIRKKYS